MQANRNSKTKILPSTQKRAESDAREPMPLESAYADGMRSIRASEELMQKTMQQMHAKRRAMAEQVERGTPLAAASVSRADSKHETRFFAQRAPKLARILAAAACVCLLLTGAYVFYRPALVPMTTLSAHAADLQKPFALQTAESQMVRMTLGEYSTLTGVDLSSLFEGYRITDEECDALYDENNNVLSDYASVWYADGEKQIRLTSSTESSYEADMLMKGASVLSDGVPLHFGKIAEDDRLIAAWESRGHIFYMQSTSLARRAFVLAAEHAASLCR